MIEIKRVTIKKFFRDYPPLDIDFVKEGLITSSDVSQIRSYERVPVLENIKRLITYLPYTARNPRFMGSFIIPQVVSSLFDRTSKEQDIKNIEFIRYATLVSKISTSFKPRNILEIGTYFGVGATFLKHANPGSTVYTINPKITSGANNSLAQEKIGFFYKKKGAEINQIWADSTKYDFSELPTIDFTYIDGNHAYEYVLKDLINTSKITKKCIVLDDYIPMDYAIKKGIPFGPWNQGVVKAVKKFLESSDGDIASAYWLKGTKTCVLTK